MLIFGGPGGWLAALIPGLLALIFLWQAGLAVQSTHAAVRILAPIIIILFLIHGFLNPNNQTTLFSLGPLSLGAEGLEYAALVAIRLTAALAVSFVLVMSTHPGHLVQGLVDTGMPYGLAYLLGSPLLLLPRMADRVNVVRAAQQSRGLETRGNIFQRAKALLPLAAPFILGALVDVEERALALEVRGFNAPFPKTSLNELHDSKTQRIARWSMMFLAIVLLIAGLIWRVYVLN